MPWSGDRVSELSVDRSREWPHEACDPGSGSVSSSKKMLCADQHLRQNLTLMPHSLLWLFVPGELPGPMEFPLPPVRRAPVALHLHPGAHGGHPSTTSTKHRNAVQGSAQP